MAKGGIFRGSRKQLGGKRRRRRKRRYYGGIFRGTKRQLGGAFPLLALIPGAIAGAKAAAAAAALGAAGAAGHELVSAISRKARGAGRRRFT